MVIRKNSANKAKSFEMQNNGMQEVNNQEFPQKCLPCALGSIWQGNSELLGKPA
jgi:hypothetical protein